ncbi:uncharacterized protein CPUR_00214 [Claviceps purpurea 20.1]|uniref:Threonine/serine exporter-like N-terminal domain-containing protein n=1 Tax=Claviceps purpurea (strain 20.1) TaxID=1111077 RepID=M1W1F2_CLAP2|nr:uncharacterized protein CPUR_00214 [Claviceps purpurea 20.1]
MDRRRVAASTESWRTVDSGWTSGYELEEIHGVMDGANYHGDHATQDDTHNASEQHHQSPSPSDGVRYRASHAGRHRLTTTTPVVSPRASPPASQRRVSGGPVPTTVHMSRISARQQYLVQLCRAIITFGALTHQLEEYMSMSSLPLEIEGESNFSYIPDCMTIRFSHGVVELVRASEGIDLGRAQDVHDINMDVAHGRLGVEEAARRLDGVSGARSKYKVWFLIMMHGLASACVAPFGFGGSLIDTPIAFILGCTVGVMQLVIAAKSERRHAYVFEILAAAITSFMARGFGSINNGQLFCFSALAQSSIVMCLPGYVILCGSFELHGRKNAASSRMVYVVAYILRLGCGIPIGAALYGMMDSNATIEMHCIKPPLSREWCVLFVACFTVCLCIILLAKWRQIPAMTVAAVAGFCVFSYSTEHLPNHLSHFALIPPMLGALTVAIIASLYSRLSGRAQRLGLDFVDSHFWRRRVQPRLLLFSGRRHSEADAWPLPSPSDPEANTAPPPSIFNDGRRPREVGHHLAAATMLPGLLVLVPAGLAATGSLLVDIHTPSAVNATTIHLGLGLLQVATGISFGVSLGALILGPLGRSGLTSL